MGHGLVTNLVGEYKTWALKMLAAERLTQGQASDDENPIHYENRLTADLGQSLGLNVDDIRRAELDVHARSRFSRLSQRDVLMASARCRDLFDIETLLKAVVTEI